MGGQRNSPVLVGSLLCKVQRFRQRSRFTLPFPRNVAILFLPFPAMSPSSPCSSLREILSQLFVLQRFSAGNRAGFSLLFGELPCKLAFCREEDR